MHYNKGRKPWNTGIRPKTWDIRYPIKSVLVENSTYARHSLKKRLIDDKIIPYICAMCGIGPVWMGKPMLLVLDHINGINNDNRINNLRFVCSNCDSQLDTYKARNKRKIKPPGNGHRLESEGYQLGMSFEYSVFRH